MYWPEFGQAGKEDITVAMVMGHRSGVIGPRTRLTPQETLDWDSVCPHIAAAAPVVGARYCAGLSHGDLRFILGEITRRVTGRTLGQFLPTEIAEPLGIDVHVGLPATEHHRCAEMVNKPHIRDVLADGDAPGHPVSLDEHPMAGLSIAMGFVPDDEVGSAELDVWRSVEFPAIRAVWRGRTSGYSATAARAVPSGSSISNTASATRM